MLVARCKAAIHRCGWPEAWVPHRARWKAAPDPTMVAKAQLGPGLCRLIEKLNLTGNWYTKDSSDLIVE
jgi:hypothetical protein